MNVVLTGQDISRLELSLFELGITGLVINKARLKGAIKDNIFKLL